MKRKASVRNSKILLLCVILGLTYSSHALSQDIFIENGYSLSTLFKNFKYPDSEYEFAVGINFLHSDYFFLSGSIGYIGKGGKITAYTEDMTRKEVRNNKYITFNTVFNLKKSFRNTDLYAGMGPRVDFKTSSGLKEIKDNSNSTILGLKCNIGINHYISNLLMGVNFSYLPSFTDFQPNINVKEKTFTLGLIVGRCF